VPYSRKPAWRYFPQSDPPPSPLVEVAAAFASMSSWFKTTFWPPIDARKQDMKTTLITQQLENYLKPDAHQPQVSGDLLAGWNVETREKYPKIPLLYGENGKLLHAVDPDAIHVSDEGRWSLLEIEGGGALTNNRAMKDLVETLLIPQADYLALAVPHQVHGRSPYDVVINLVQAMYGRGIPQQHARGIMIAGY
jgi:hypothetical protein